MPSQNLSLVRQGHLGRLRRSHRAGPGRRRPIRSLHLPPGSEVRRPPGPSLREAPGRLKRPPGPTGRPTLLPGHSYSQSWSSQLPASGPKRQYRVVPNESKGPGTASTEGYTPRPAATKTPKRRSCQYTRTSAERRFGAEGSPSLRAFCPRSNYSHLPDRARDPR